MIELSTTDVPGWVHDSIQGEAVTSAELPTSREINQSTVPVVTSKSEFIRLEDGKEIPSQTQLLQIGPNHGRSFEVVANRTTRNIGRLAVWRDEFDNAFTSLSLKGNDFSHDSVVQSATAPSGYAAMGLLESDSLTRVLRSSRMMREAHMATEWINRVFEPSELIYKGERVSQAEYKRRLLRDTANTEGIEVMGKMALAIEPMTFFVTSRSMEINDRLMDLIHDDKINLPKRLQYIFRVYNSLHQNDPDFQPLDLTNKKDSNGLTGVERYFSVIFPTLLATNIAKLHELGLVHSFLTAGNVTALGGIIDLDSIKGTPLGLGDDEITIGLKVDDLITVNDNSGIYGVYAYLHRQGVIGLAHRAQANIELMDTYQALRTVRADRTEELKEQINLGSVNKLYDSAQVIDSYVKLVGDASSTEPLHAAMIERLNDAINSKWTKKSILQSVEDTLDKALRDYAGRNEIDESFLAELRKKVAATVKQVLRDDRSYLSRVVDKIIKDDVGMDNLKLAVTDPEIRKRIMEGIVVRFSSAIHTYIERDNKDGIHKKRIKHTTKSIVDDFVEHYEKGDLKDYTVSIPGFSETLKVLPKKPFFFETKSIYPYEDISFASLIKSAKKGHLSIAVEDTSIARGFFIAPPEGTVARTLITDASDIDISYYHFDEKPRDFSVDKIDGSSEYIAWIVEPHDGGSEPQLVINHRKGAAIISDIQRLYKTDVELLLSEAERYRALTTQ
jgi:hypothetical protein